MFLWVGNGLCVLKNCLLRRFGAWERLLKYAALVPLSVVIVVLFSINSFMAQIPADRGQTLITMPTTAAVTTSGLLVELLKKYLPPGSKIMTRWGRISFLC